MPNKDCSFHKACRLFTKGACTSETIKKGDCEKPSIKGIPVWVVAEIPGSDHLIAINSKCTECGKIFGVVTGDNEGIFYQAHAVKLSDEQNEKIPLFPCVNCLGQKDAIYEGVQARA